MVNVLFLVIPFKVVIWFRLTSKKFKLGNCNTLRISEILFPETDNTCKFVKLLSAVRFVIWLLSIYKYSSCITLASGSNELTWLSVIVRVFSFVSLLNDERSVIWFWLALILVKDVNLESTEISCISFQSK